MPTKPTEQTKTKTKQSDGGLWEKVSKVGNDYYFGKVITKSGETVLFRALKNEWKKEGENTPDYKIFLNDDNEIKTKPVKVKPVVKVTENEVEDDEGKF